MKYELYFINRTWKKNPDGTRAEIIAQNRSANNAFVDFLIKRNHNLD